MLLYLIIFSIIFILIIENIKSYSELAKTINEMYTNKHNYDFRVFDYKMKDRAAQWVKISVINQLLEENKYEYIFWIDSDAFFNKHDIKLESLIIDNKDIIICDDKLNSGNFEDITVNTGTIIVKCSEWSKYFFKIMYNYKGNYLYDYFHEQTVMKELIKNNILDCKNHISIENGTLFNSEINRQLNDNTLENNFIIHLAAQKNDFRQKYMDNWLRKFNV